ncbi:Protein fam86a [Mortierella sp. AD094]|nr:Protein fam86a [Mortierella sp. AD094]
MDEASQRLVLLIKRQVLQMRQIRQFQWSLTDTQALEADAATLPSVTSPEIQQAILDQIFYDPVVMKHPPSLTYQYSFLKKLISMIETENVHEISGDLLEIFTELLITAPKRPEQGGPPLKPCFKSYSLDRECSKVVTIEILAGKNVVDIGCGVGFLGIACAILGAKKVVLTDGNTEVLAMAKQNIEYSMGSKKIYKVHVEVRSTAVTPAKVSSLLSLDDISCPTTASLLDWESFTEEQIAALEAEVLIMSDLTYDPTNIVPLVTVLKAILVKGVSAYMSSAIRNPQTFIDFFARIKQECVGVEIEEILLKDIEHFLFFDEETVQTVKVFRLHFP